MQDATDHIHRYENTAVLSAACQLINLSTSPTKEDDSDYLRASDFPPLWSIPDWFLFLFACHRKSKSFKRLCPSPLFSWNIPLSHNCHCLYNEKDGYVLRWGLQVRKGEKKLFSSWSNSSRQVGLNYFQHPGWKNGFHAVRAGQLQKAGSGHGRKGLPFLIH